MLEKTDDMQVIRRDLDQLLKQRGRPGSFTAMLQRWQGIIAMVMLAVGAVVFHVQALNRIDANTLAVAEVGALKETVDTIEQNMVTRDDLERAISVHSQHPHPTAVSLEQLEFMREDLSEIKDSLRDLSTRLRELETGQ